MSENEKYPGMTVTSGNPSPEPAAEPAEQATTENVVVPYQPTEQPQDLDELVALADHLQRENAELKALVGDREAFTEVIRDAVHNPPAPKVFDPRTCTTAEYIENAAAIRKTLGIRTR